MPIKIGSTNGVLYKYDPVDTIWKQVEPPQIVAVDERQTFSAMKWVPVAVWGKEQGGLFDGKPLGRGEKAELCGVLGEGLASETPEEDEAIVE